MVQGFLDVLRQTVPLGGRAQGSHTGTACFDPAVCPPVTPGSYGRALAAQAVSSDIHARLSQARVLFNREKSALPSFLLTLLTQHWLYFAPGQPAEPDIASPAPHRNASTCLLRVSDSVLFIHSGVSFVSVLFSSSPSCRLCFSEIKNSIAFRGRIAY